MTKCKWKKYYMHIISGQLHIWWIRIRKRIHPGPCLNWFRFKKNSVQHHHIPTHTRASVGIQASPTGTWRDNLPSLRTSYETLTEAHTLLPTTRRMFKMENIFPRFCWMFIGFPCTFDPVTLRWQNRCAHTFVPQGITMLQISAQWNQHSL